MKKVWPISIVLIVSMLQLSLTAEPTPKPLKERQYCSEHPLYFRVVVGKGGRSSILGVIDESGGTGTGYDLAYVDENMNGDLTDDSARKFSRYETGKNAGLFSPTISFKGPLKGEDGTTYTLTILSLIDQTRRCEQENDSEFYWELNTEGWRYMFGGGKMKFFSSRADALKGPPVRLGGKCWWKLNCIDQDGGLQAGKVVFSAELKDDNGCTLRSVTGPGGKLSPTITLVSKDTSQKPRKMTMEFG